MKMKKTVSLSLVLLLLFSILTACGGSSKSADRVAGAVPMEEAAAAGDYAVAQSTLNTANTTAETGSDTLPEGRKWIITIDMNVETEDLDALMTSLTEKINALNGYVEDQNIHNGSTYASRRYRSATLTIRIPDEKVESFTSDISGLANVVSQNLRREDITLQYVATSNRVTALETEEARLLELLAQAETMEDLLEIEARLTDVRYELENYASQLRLYDNQVDYATIYLCIEEVQEYTPVEEPSFWERIRNTFSNSLEGLGEGITNLTVFLLGNSPYLLTYGALALVIVLLVRRIRTRNAKKKAAKPEQT